MKQLKLHSIVWVRVHIIPRESGRTKLVQGVVIGPDFFGKVVVKVKEKWGMQNYAFERDMVRITKPPRKK